jgi:hypothetical protein
MKSVCWRMAGACVKVKLQHASPTIKSSPTTHTVLLNCTCLYKYNMNICMYVLHIHIFVCV